MNILLATKLMDVGGIERSVVALARALRSRDHNVWVISSGGQLVSQLEHDGTPHLYAPLVITSPAGMARSARVIRRAILEKEIDLLHSFSATSSVAANVAVHMLGRGGPPVRFISSPMGLQNSPRELGATTWLRNWFMTIGAERILVISPEIRRHLKNVGAREEALVDFNFVGLDPDSYRAGPDDRLSVRQEFGFPADARIVSTIGALHPRKSHELFVDAACLIARQAPEARFLIVGGGEQHEDLQRQAHAKGLDGKLVLTGVRDDVARLLAATDVYVKPGIVEGFIGITVLEALALGKPVVAFETEDVKLALTHGVTGLVAANADVADLAEKIVYLLRNPQHGLELGDAGRQVVVEKFHFGLLAQRLEQFYQRMLAARAPAAA